VQVGVGTHQFGDHLGIEQITPSPDGRGRRIGKPAKPSSNLRIAQEGTGACSSTFAALHTFASKGPHKIPCPTRRTMRPYVVKWLRLFARGELAS
jgi:hypothetical protein